MNTAETAHWLNGLLPGEPEFHQVGAFRVAGYTLGEESIACSVDFGRVNTGLYTEEVVEVRSELLCLARAEASVPGRAVGAAATLLFDASLQSSRDSTLIPMHAQPGQLLPGVGIMANLPQEGYTVVHGILADPRIWGEQIPLVREQAGEVTAEAPDVPGEHGRLTLPLQLILLTESEFATAVSEGGDVLFAQMAEQQVDLLDLHR
ncbi:hypothetical protein CDES_01320 [Corynebacterium deserti GIMN1.010]|uniref:Suppressor of fused-like domain-containing protein n=1 Tax=Corynebacterium deserti GIMN1.010 TaxID=931089 RepID=A0A0M4CHK0_9CORY|nr:hypothetical protein [Corynebacterium deserti]ALC04738.1 hypothetical protein CDES_01320 [Corynebacterium deserti GIMN1.010]